MDAGFAAALALAALVGALALMAVGATAPRRKLVKLTGSTTVTPSQQATDFLANNGVAVTPTGQATFANGAFTFPVVKGFGNTKHLRGRAGPRRRPALLQGRRSAVMRRLVAVRAADTSVLLAQLPGQPGNCGHVKRALQRWLSTTRG